MKFFKNVTWPEGAIYNITPQAGSKTDGGADIEHIYVEGDKKNVWLQKRTDKVLEAILDYAEYANTRVCNS